VVIMLEAGRSNVMAARIRLLRWIGLMLVVMPCIFAAAAEKSPEAALKWRQLPAIPDREGFAGPFAGVSGGALIVAGGANFPGQRPWEGGTKVWSDSIYVLERPDGSWNLAGKLARPTAYGGCVNAPDGVVCIGGGDAQRHFRNVDRLQWKEGRIATTALPDLPRPCALASGALVGHTIYVAGGIEKPDAAQCLAEFSALDLGPGQTTWNRMPACPGAARMLAVAGAADGSFFLVSGVRLRPGPDGKPVREYLNDAWRFTPGAGWHRLADAPRAAAAAPSPAVVLPGPKLLVISGDDGTKVGWKPENTHPGFSRDVLAYDVKQDAWSVMGKAPFSRATAPTTVWRGGVAIPNGEVRPGYRSPEVWRLEMSSEP
jgi:N-acetylneuraminic acid mutarotase